MSSQYRNWCHPRSRIFWIVITIILTETVPVLSARFAPAVAAYSDPFFFWLLVSGLVFLPLSRKGLSARRFGSCLLISTSIVLIHFHVLAGTMGSNLGVKVGFDRHVYYVASDYGMSGEYSGTTEYRRRLIFFQSVSQSDCNVTYAYYGPKLIYRISGSVDAERCTISR